MRGGEDYGLGPESRPRIPMSQSQEAAFARWLQGASMNIVGPHPEDIIDTLRATFLAGWDARERHKAAEGVQVSFLETT